MDLYTKKEPDMVNIKVLIGTSDGIRTRVAALRGRCPRPLDHGGKLAGELGFEPRLYESES